MMTAVFISGMDGVEASATAMLEDRLKLLGLKMERRDKKTRCGFGIIMFRTLDEQVRRFVFHAAENGAVRIVCVSCTRQLNARDAWSLLDAGAADVLHFSDIENTANDIKARIDRWHGVDLLMDTPWITERIGGVSAVWRRKIRDIVETASYTSLSVLLMGESGTGKELVSNLIHEFDPRESKGNLVILDCTTIMPELSGSEFFGHERGAFTGAVSQRDGAFALADNGTLFLDEIGELPLQLQAQLLRVIQEKTFKRVGGNVWHKTEFRLVCATNKNIEELVGKGLFRSDLYFRVAGVVYTLPPLRERPEDIKPLVHYFMRSMNPEGEVPSIDDAVKDYLFNHDYPGNVRELRQRVTRLMHRYMGGGVLTLGAIPLDDHPCHKDDQASCRSVERFETIVRSAVLEGIGLKELRRIVEDMAVRFAVDDSDGNLQKAAQILGVTDRALQMRKANQRESENTG